MKLASLALTRTFTPWLFMPASPHERTVEQELEKLREFNTSLDNFDTLSSRRKRSCEEFLKSVDCIVPYLGLNGDPSHLPFQSAGEFCPDGFFRKRSKYSARENFLSNRALHIVRMTEIVVVFSNPPLCRYVAAATAATYLIGVMPRYLGNIGFGGCRYRKIVALI
ncbi:hypothetical protein COLO4_03701 [Corchorus olitorius]|uniref:Uncharacterized protein n=1 Tax=Corchorus olitorius TaxID=93759 RepID=A0A1R3KXJ2_9ROSI|nr:hypothetical protein COLO4_03701 [Corchorus olitorius]